MLTNVSLLLARLLMSAIFIQSGFHKLTAYATVVPFFANLHLPMPQVAWAVAVAVELGGGLLILAGFRVKLVAPMMAVFCVATAFIVHYHPGDTTNMISFMKNLAMAGGFLQLAVTGPGRYSIGRR